MTKRNEYYKEVNSEGAMEEFLSDLVDLLAKGEATVLTVRIPTEQWIDMIFDIIETDTQYQIEPGQEAFLDLVFACDAMEEGDDDIITNTLDPFDGSDPMRDLEELMRDLRNALEEGDDDDDED
tara:strand:- start:1040 stop:1411 length:372 start_codon:yes stop_codon:yes gene_type:complete